MKNTIPESIKSKLEEYASQYSERDIEMIEKGVSIAIELAALPNAGKQDVPKYNADFLWGFDDDSIEALGYEFANAKTEEYQKECWNDLIKTIAAASPNAVEFAELIEDAVNAYFHQAQKELGRKDIGDIEKRNWTGIKSKCELFLQSK
jgi:hypothetical protein